MGRALAPASGELAKNRLLISESLAKKLDAFFNKMVLAGITLNLALDPMVPNGQPRADLWDEARDTAHKEIPALLTAIRDEAKGVIHG